MGWLFNLSALVAEQNMIIEGLIKIFVLKGFIAEGEIDEIKAKITKQSIWEKRRELNYSKKDLDEFEFR